MHDACVLGPFRRENSGNVEWLEGPKRVAVDGS